MSRLVLVIARSGTGKSSSLRNLKREEAGIVLCSGKELPFQNDLKTVVPKSYGDILTVIKDSVAPIIVIDDINYMMSFEEMNRVNEIGYQKFTQMASNMFGVFNAIREKESDQIFYLFAHPEESPEDGNLRIKTTGKMLSEKVVLEGLSNIVLTTDLVDGEFIFKVKTDGSGVKAPMGMFETETIPNDIKLVDAAIRKFYAPKKEVKK